MATIVQTGLWFCTNCLLASSLDDYTSLDYWYSPEEANARENAIREGLAALRLVGEPVPDYDDELQDGVQEISRDSCDCCGDTDAGPRYRHAQIA